MTTFLQHLGLRSKCHNAPFMTLYGWHDNGKDDRKVCSDVSHHFHHVTTSNITKKDIDSLVDAVVASAPNYEALSHTHCWNQEQPSACGISLVRHKQCCLCPALLPQLDY